METTISCHGRTTIPALIRAKYHIKSGDHLTWIDNGQTIYVIPLPSDPIQALFGSGRGQNLTAKLLEERRQDRKREQ
jgi:AbrB family looped-hinge helix DNA binding protein